MLSPFNIASKVLRARLAMTNRVDISVLDRNEAERPSNLNDHPGRLFCYLTNRRNGMPFLLAFAREDPSRDISHVFCFYVNTNYRKIQPSECKLFEKKLGDGVRLGLDVKLGVLKATVDVPRPVHLYVLIQMGEFFLTERLYTQFVAEKTVDHLTIPSWIAAKPGIPLPECSIGGSNTDSAVVWDALCQQDSSLRRLDIVAMDLDRPPSRVSSMFDVLKIRYDKHILYAIHYKFSNFVMVIVTHPALLRSSREVAAVTGSIKSLLEASRIDCGYIGATRLIRNPYDKCDSASTIKALAIALSLPMLAIKESDVEIVLPDKELLASTRQLLSVRSSPEIDVCGSFNASDWPSSQESSSSVLAEPEVPISSLDIDVEVDVVNFEPVGAGSYTLSSQETVILSQREIRRFLSDCRRRQAGRDSLANQIPSIELTPMDDPGYHLFKCETSFVIELELIVNSYGLPATPLPVLFLNEFDTSFRAALEDTNRMLVVPVSIAAGLVVLLIDEETEEWGLLDADIDTQRDGSVFGRVAASMSARDNPFREYAGRQIKMPCHFHTDCKNMHMLLAVYCISQAFNYARMLPLRVAYTEKRLRLFCYHYCLTLQEANQDYNERNGLVRPNGFLETGAFRALPSPLVFEQSVVATDRCVFCDKRYHKNLGSHMSMAHGGQAAAKRRRRRWLESL